MNTLLNDHTLRHQSRYKRRTMPAAKREACSMQAAKHVLNYEVYQSAEHVALYMPHDGEIDPRFIMLAEKSSGKKFYLPVMDEKNKRHLIFYSFNSENELSPNAYGILQPIQKNPIELTQLELVLTPLVAFDSKKNRLGMGGGYYDTTFQYKKSEPNELPFLLGVAYACQQLKQINPHPWDVSLDAVATEAGLLI